MANMNTTQEIAAIVESVANKRAKFDEQDLFAFYSAEEFQAYLDYVVA
jgi:hypothetical protein